MRSSSVATMTLVANFENSARSYTRWIMGVPAMGTKWFARQASGTISGGNDNDNLRGAHSNIARVVVLNSLKVAGGAQKFSVCGPVDRGSNALEAMLPQAQT